MNSRIATVALSFLGVVGAAFAADQLSGNRVTVGQRAPTFTLEDQHGKRVTLSKLRGRKAVLVFYRGHW